MSFELIASGVRHTLDAFGSVGTEVLHGVAIPLEMLRSQLSVPAFYVAAYAPPDPWQGLALICVVLFMFAAFVARWYVKYPWLFDARAHVSVLLWYFAEGPVRSPSALRQLFVDTPMPTRRPVANHTHGSCAADRSDASSFADLFARRTGLTAYYVQQSASDLRAGREGSRSYYWPKDVCVPPRAFCPPDDAIITLIDVDHYINMPEFVINVFRPTLIYTFQPSAVASDLSEYSFTFNADNFVEYQVSGSAKYVHKVWNYAHDSLLLTSTRFGIPYRAAVFMVDRRQIDDHHALVLLTPVARWTWPCTFLSRFLDVVQLDRLRVAYGDFLRLRVQRAEGAYVSTGRVGCHMNATIRAAEDDAIASIARTSKLDLTNPQVQKFVDGDRPGSAALLEYHRAETSEKKDTVCPVEKSVHRYQFRPEFYDSSAKASMQAFMSPIADGAYAPDLSRHNERAAVEQRIVDVRPEALTMTPALARIMGEFVDFLRPAPAERLLPTDSEEVFERQNRPTQRRILEEASYSTPVRVIRSFQKREVYSGPKAPRVISQINGVDKLKYSCYMYSLGDYLKRFKWFACGKIPRKIARRVARILDKASTVLKTDMDKCDGRVSELARELERLVALALFDPSVHDELLELMRSQFDLTGYAPLGTKYQTEYARNSGSPETTLLNTLLCVFCAYLGYRMTEVEGGHMSPGDAWAKLGIFLGDDGLSPDADPAAFIRAAALMGQKLTAEVVKRGDLGVMFLARVYGPDVWFGDTNSCCDLYRQLTKFHVTSPLPSTVTAEMKLNEKVAAFYLTDRNTPYLGWFCQAYRACVLRTRGRLDSSTSYLNIWNADIPVEDQYPNDNNGNWMDAYAKDALLGADPVPFLAWLARCTQPSDFLRPVLVMELPPPLPPRRPVVIDEETVLPADHSGSPPPVAEPGDQVGEPRKPRKTSFRVNREAKVPRGAPEKHTNRPGAGRVKRPAAGRGTAGAILKH